MTTITIDAPMTLKKTHFKDHLEAVFYLVQYQALQKNSKNKSTVFQDAMTRYHNGETVDAGDFLSHLIAKKSHVSM